MTVQNDAFASGMLIDYGDDPNRPPAFAMAEPLPYSESNRGYESSMISTSASSYGDYSYSTPNVTTPPATTTIVPYDSELATNSYSSQVTNKSYSSQSVNEVQNEAMAKKNRRRRRRRARMAAAGVTGAVVGGIALGPLGAAAGGVGAAAATRAASKIGEKRKDRRVEQEGVAHDSVTSNAPILNAVAC